MAQFFRSLRLVCLTVFLLALCGIGSHVELLRSAVSGELLIVLGCLFVPLFPIMVLPQAFRREALDL